MARNIVNPYVRARNLRMGFEAEGIFVRTMKSMGFEVEKTAIEIDRKMHIDFIIDGFGFDVKGNRKLNAIWLELQNTNGDHGWLKGAADYIAFHFPDLNVFKIFKTPELLEFVEQNVTEKASDNKPYMKMYTRKDRSDIITKVRYSDIKHLTHKIIKCVDDY
jgi:hypothetical protein